MTAGDTLPPRRWDPKPQVSPEGPKKWERRSRGAVWLCRAPARNRVRGAFKTRRPDAFKARIAPPDTLAT
jgi:hypothetical protein